MTKRIQPNSVCPCRKGTDRTLSYARCCGRFHKGKLYPDTAEELMRSRYSAYALSLPNYLYRSWHPDTRPTLQSLRELCKSGNPEYSGLSIIDTKAGGPNDSHGVVEFVARFSLPESNNSAELIPDGSTDSIRERSSFGRIKSQWVYVCAENIENE